MPDPTKPSVFNLRNAALLAGGGILLFVVGRSLGRRDSDEAFSSFMSAAPGPDTQTQLTETAASASSLSAQLYDISRRLRDGT